YWVHDSEEGGKNLYEEELLAELLKRERKNLRWSYTKILHADQMKDWAQNVGNQLNNELNAVVINFIDMLAHARSEMTIIRELAPDEAALRSISKSWLQHSALLTALERLAREDVTIVLTTDHGVTRVRRPLKIVGDRETTTNLRYKQGRNLNYDEKDRRIMGVRKPGDIRLPVSTVSGSYAFCLEDGYFVYPNNYNKFVNLYADTFQHGGISLEEMIVPLAILGKKS
ncbi:MAG: two-component system response regulator, partial [Sphingobacteriia bacterium]